MTKRDIFMTVIDTVCTLCEVDASDILNGVKRSECVEARSIAAHFLMKYGVLPNDVIRFSNNTVRHRYCVTKSASSYYDRYRQSFSFRCSADAVGNALSEI